MAAKWVAAVIITWLVVMFGSIAMSEYNGNQCRMAAIERNMSADDILKLCK